MQLTISYACMNASHVQFATAKNLDTVHCMSYNKKLVLLDPINHIAIELYVLRVKLIIHFIRESILTKVQKTLQHLQSNDGNTIAINS